MAWEELNRAGELALERGEYSEAQRYLLKAVTEVSRDEPGRLASTLYTLGKAHAHLNDYARAEAALTRALSILGKLLGHEHVEVARVIDELGLIYFNEQKYDQAEPLVRRALEMRRKLLGDEHPDLAQSMVSVASLCESQKRPDEAIQLLTGAIAMQENMYGADDLRLAPALGLLAVHFFNKKDFVRAQDYSLCALTLRETHLGANHPDVAVSLHVMAMIYLSQFNFDEAANLYQRALQIREACLPPGHSAILSVVKHLALCYYCLERYEEADAAYEHLENIAESANHSDYLLTAFRQRSWLRFKKGQLGECESYTKQALERMKELEITDKKTTDSLNTCLFSACVGQKKFLQAARALPGTAVAMTKGLLDSKATEKHGRSKNGKQTIVKKKPLPISQTNDHSQVD